MRGPGRGNNDPELGVYIWCGGVAGGQSIGVLSRNAAPAQARQPHGVFRMLLHCRARRLQCHCMIACLLEEQQYYQDKNA